VIAAYDEEFISVARNYYGYSPSVLIDVLFWSAESYFADKFLIDFWIVDYVFWDSNDAVTDPTGMRDEVMREVGFTPNKARILAAFTDQDIDYCWGVANSTLGVVLVQHAYLDGVGQATDNVIQHEISHLYQAPEHYVDGMMCVMNLYSYWIDAPYWYSVPTALVTNNWCSDCINIISSNRPRWGVELVTGSHNGGGGGGPNHPRGIELEKSP